MPAVEDFVAAPQGVGAADIGARAFGVRFGHVERLGEERLQFIRSRQRKRIRRQFRILLGGTQRDGFASPSRDIQMIEVQPI